MIRRLTAAFVVVRPTVLVACPLFAQQAPDGESDRGASQPDVNSDEKESSPEATTDGSQDQNQAAEEESIFEQLIVDPYNRRYGHPPGGGWIPIPETRTELRVAGLTS